jgi:hypothetical protein
MIMEPHRRRKKQRKNFTLRTPKRVRPLASLGKCQNTVIVKVGHHENWINTGSAQPVFESKIKAEFLEWNC